MARTDTYRPSLRQILAGLSTAQVFAIAAVLVILAISAFGLGYWIASTAEETRAAEIAAEQAETRLSIARISDALGRTEDELAALRAEQVFLQNKSQILSLMVLFDDAEKRTAAADPDDAEAWSDYQGLADRLFNVVTDLDQRSAAGEAEIPIRAHVGKGQEPTLTFEQDGTTYPLPGIFATAAE